MSRVKAISPAIRRTGLVRLAAVMGLSALLAGCPRQREDDRQPDRPAPGAAPASQPDGDWPAFHGGGRLLGVASAIPAPPMAVRWTFRTAGGGIRNSAAIVGQTVYVADDRDTLHAIDLASGRERWAYKSDDGFAACPLVLDERVFLGDLGGVFHAIDARSGGKLWTFDTEGAAIHSSANSVPATGHIVFANDGGRVTCLNAADGKQVWASEQAQTNGALAVADGFGWSGTCEGKLHSIDLADGQRLLEIALEAETGASPAVADGKVVIGTYSGEVVCFDALTGDKLWAAGKVGQKNFSLSFDSSCAVADGLIVIGSPANAVVALDLAAGGERWRFPTQDEVDSSPAVSDGRVYVGCDDGRLYVLDLRSGRLLWQFEAGGRISAGPAVGRGVVVFGTTDGAIYCLEPKR